MMSHLLVKAIILVCLNFVVEIKCGCPVSDNPSQMFQCLTINPQAFIDLISKGDYKSFCHMANGYMTCMTTYVRDCLGGKAATGILEELQDLNLKCCISGRAQECVVKNPALLQKCFSSDDFVTLANGETKNVMEVVPGDQVKAIDKNGLLIDSEVLDILHKNTNSSTLFKVIHDDSGNQISLTNSHLIYEKTSQAYIKASRVNVGHILRVYSRDAPKLADFHVKKITYDLKTGFIAPLTREGTILVNNLDCSCYAEVNDHQLADLVMSPFKLYKRIVRTLFDSTSTSANHDVDIYARMLTSIANTFFSSILA